MKLIHYLAYGSNLHPARLKQRVPSSQAIGLVELPEYDLRWHKIGVDNSGKCDAFFTANANDVVFGIVYSMRADERYRLDAAEGLGNGYNLQNITLSVNNIRREVFLYLADPDFIDQDLAPYSWYKNLVIEGANYHALPDAYRHALRQVSCKEDPDEARALEHKIILDSMSSR